MGKYDDWFWVRGWDDRLLGTPMTWVWRWRKTANVRLENECNNITKF